MMERALLTPDELKSIPKGSFIVMKTGTHPMRTRLQLFLNWGITFGEPYVVPERANRAVAYANRVDLERNLPQLSEPEEMDESRGYAVSSRGGIAHAPAQEREADEDIRRGGTMSYFGTIYADTELPSRAMAVYMYLRDRSDAEGKCWPGIKTIASDMKLSRSTVKRALHDLERHGYLKKASRQRANGSSTSNLYTVI